MKRTASIFALVAAFFLFSSASVWEGTASFGPAARFSQEGAFGLSSVFPDSRLVDVINLVNGKTVRLKIIRSTTGQDGVFLVLSPAAAAALGLQPGDNASVSVSLVELQPDPSVSLFQPGSAGISDPDETLKLLAQNELDLRQAGATGAGSGRSASAVESSPNTAPTAAPFFAAPQSLPATNAGVLPSQIVKKLFVQVGVFGTAAAMATMIASLPKEYMIEVRAFMFGGRRLYKLLVGPMDQNETRGVRDRVRSIGIKDAFITE